MALQSLFHEATRSMDLFASGAIDPNDLTFPG